MKKLINIAVFFLCALASTDVQAIPNSETVIDRAAGIGATVWEKNGEIHALVLNAGSGWASSTVVSNPSIPGLYPRVAVNNLGAIAVIWIEYSANGDWILAGATYDYTTSTWNARTVISDPNDGLLTQEDHRVRISDTNVVAVSYSSVDLTTFNTELRGIICPVYGTWTAPVTIVP